MSLISRAALRCVVLALLSGCATRPGSKPVPPPVIEKAADTKVPDAGDASPQTSDAATPNSDNR
jgi:hypothetical protein